MERLRTMENRDLHRKHIYFTGSVQGVGFRYRAIYLARPLGLTGWVRNLWDGRVEMEVQGSEERIQLFLAQLGQQRFISIKGMEQSELDVIEESDFCARG